MFTKFNRIISLLLIITLIFSMQVIGIIGNNIAFAAWNGSVATKFSYGSGTSSSPYQIRNESEFAYFMSRINSGITFEGSYFVLTNNIDMTGGTMNTPTGTFKGNFNGKGFKIISTVPFLYEIGTNGSVNLLHYVSTSLVSDELLCYVNKGNISSCLVNGNLSVSDSDVAFYRGLFCNTNYGVINNSAVIGSIKTSGSDSDSYVGSIAYKNTGTIQNSYAAVSYTFNTTGRYSSDYGDGFIYKNEGTVNNCYYNNDVCSYSSTSGTPRTTSVMQSNSFVTTLNNQNPTTDSLWTSDANFSFGGYPILKVDSKIEETVQLSYNSSEYFTYHSSSFSTKFVLSSSRSCLIYYTLDGSDPKTSSTRKKYSSGYITISGDATIKMVASYNGVYGRVTTQRVVSMLGDGTASNPYQISDKNDLIAVSLDTTACYILKNNIAFSDSDYSTNGILSAGWKSIGNFSGIFDGNGHSIENLQGTEGGFVNYNTGTISNLLLTKTKLYGKANFGAVVNSNSGSILRCFVELNIDKDIGVLPVENVGGVVGSNGGTVKYCYTTGTLYVSEPLNRYGRINVGGIAGTGYVQNSYSDISATIYHPGYPGTEFIYYGGISGAGSAYQCVADTNVNVNFSLSYDAYVGTIISSKQGYSASNCYGRLNHSVGGSLGGGSYINNLVTYNWISGPERLLESSFPNFDFTENWIITEDGPMPQGVMNSDGTYYTKESYTAPTCTTDGATVCKTQSNKTVTHKLKAYGHSLNKGCCIRCSHKEIYSIQFKNATADNFDKIYKDCSYQLEAIFEPIDAIDKTITWLSSDNTIATISQEGILSCLNCGTVKISATANNGVKAEMELTVTEVPYLNDIVVSNVQGAIVGDTDITHKITFSTNKDAYALYCFVKYPENLSLKSVIAKDFLYVETEDENTVDGYTTAVILAQYADGKLIPQNTIFTPFELVFDISKSAEPGIVNVEVTEETRLIGNDVYMFEERVKGELEILPKLAEGIKIIGEEIISTITNYSVSFSPDYATSKEVVWSVDNEAIATVDCNGVVTPITSGTITLIASTKDGSGVYDTKTITIIRSVEAIEILGDDSITEPTEYTVNIIPSYATMKEVEWSISNDKIATISQDGVVIPITSGWVTILAVSKDGSGVNASKDVNIIKLAESIVITGEDSISSPAQYKAMVLPDYTSDKEVSWSVDNMGVATVNELGIVTPVTSGTVILTATAKDGSGVVSSKTIEIVKLAESIEIVGSEEIIEPSQYSVVILPEYTTNKDVQWSVSDETVATVNENGLVTPLKNGKIVLTARSLDESGIETTKSIVITVSARANSITSDVGIWDKEFDSSITEYIINVPSGTTIIYLTSNFKNATAKVNGSITFDGVRKKVTLEGMETDVELVLTPATGSNLLENTYKITVICGSFTKTTVSGDGKLFTVIPTNIGNGKMVILALYDGEKFVEMQSAVCTGEDISFATTKTYTKAKVMVWDSFGSLMPLTGVELILKNN